MSFVIGGAVNVLTSVPQASLMSSFKAVTVMSLWMNSLVEYGMIVC